MQRQSILFTVIVILAVSTGCSWSGDPGNANQDANLAAGALPEYSDANLALADGTRFLDQGETDKAIDALNQAVKLNPDLAEGWFRLGIAYALAEKRDETIAETNELEPESSPTGRPTKPNSVKAFEKAVAAYKKLVEVNEEDDLAHFNLGRAYNKLNDDEDAARALKQAVRIKPDDTEYQTELGSILIKLAQYQQAIPPLKKALELDPENIRAQELLEDAEAGRKRVNYTATPKEDKKPADSNSNTDEAEPSADKQPTPTPAAPPPPRPSPSRPGM
jgi:tetratricopeptide (TPR) repeat protein